MKRPSSRNAFLLSLVNFSLIYTHYLTIYFFIAQSITALLFLNANRKGFWQFVISQLAVVVLFAPWMVVVFKVMPEMGTYWIRMAEWPVLKNIFISIASSKRMALIAVIIIGLGLVSALYHHKKHGRFENKMLIMIIIWGVGIFLMHYLVGKYKPIFIYKYTLYGTMGFLLLFLFSTKLLPISRILKVGILIYAVVWYAFRFRFDMPKSEDWKSAMANVNENKSKHDIVLIQAS